ncbi:MAG: hypothetical protein M1834_007054 [Cirrosporium novae-zelandiae]|nr:MAG: hypothetical protein M1834_007054 [Cirrosporium novae-zelandiae]
MALDSVYNQYIAPQDLPHSFRNADAIALTPERLHELAEFAPDKCTAFWHLGLATVLTQISSFHNEIKPPLIESALYHTQEAYNLEPNSWEPRYSLARVCGMQRQYSDAIRVMQEALDRMPRDLKSLKSRMLPKMAHWQWELGDRNSALHTAQQAFEMDKTRPSSQIAYIDMLHREGHSAKIIDTPKDLHSIQCMDGALGNSCLERLFLIGESLSNIFKIAGQAYQANKDEAEFIVHAMDIMIKTARPRRYEQSRFWLFENIGVWKYQYDDQVEDCIRLLETASTMRNKSKEGRYNHTIENLLARLYFDSAVAAWNGTGNLYRYTRDLKELVNRVEVTEGDSDEPIKQEFYGIGYPTMLHGKWLRAYEKAEETEWRKYFKTRILEDIEKLDDLNPLNDMSSLYSLAITLLLAADERNAAAILGILFKLFEKRGDVGDVGEKRSDGIQYESSAERYRSMYYNFIEPKETCFWQTLERMTGRAGISTGITDSLGFLARDSFSEHFRSQILGQLESSKVYSEDWEIKQVIFQICELPRADTLLGPKSDEDNGPSIVDRDKTAKATSNPDHGCSPPESVKIASTSSTSENETEEQSSLLVEDPGLNKYSWIGRCDGGECPSSYRGYKKLFFCKVCPGKKFCDKCVEHITNNTLVRRDCDPAHEKYQAWPIPKKVRGKQRLMRRGEMMLLS